jgi:transcriptional regulator with XRE-family HTH domain
MQGESARRIGVDPSTLARWERGERQPTGALLKRAERFLGTLEEAHLVIEPHRVVA